MSALSRKLSMSLKEIKGEHVPWYSKLTVKLDDINSWIRKKLYWHELKCFMENFLYFLKQAYHWRDFDSSYSIEAFAQNLDRLADGLKRWNNHTQAQRSYRRCKFAAHLLRQAYSGEYVLEDKSYSNWSKNNEIYFGACDDEESNKRGMRQLRYRRKYPEDYSRKMFKIIQKRTQAVEKQRKKEAWEYIHKYIECWWD